MSLDFSWTRPAFNLPALAAGTVLSPAWLTCLHIAGDEYGVALAALLAAAWLDHRRHTWATRVLVFAIAVGSIATWPVVAGTIHYLTGVTP